jgi:hypothetical protein
VLKIEKVQKL